MANTGANDKAQGGKSMLLRGLAPSIAFVAAVATASAAMAQTPKRGGILNFASVAETSGYDCHASQTFALLHPITPQYSLLVKFDATMKSEIIGDLAKSWTVAPDGLTYTFKLHDGIKFHDGSDLTSADIKATFERIISPPEGVISVRKERFVDVAVIETPDPLTVIFKLKAVNASFLTLLASPFNCVYSAAKLKQNPKYPDTEVMGSGAYQIVEHVRGSHWTAKRFDNYFRKGLPYIDGYKVFFVKDTAVVPGLLGGQFDAEFRGQNPSARDQLLAKAKERFVVHESPWATVMLLIFNTTKKPFDDIRVRQALSLALDRYAGGNNLSKISIMKHVGGIMRPGSEWALPDAELEKQVGYSKDIEKSRAQARKLLKEAGAEGLKIKLFNRTVAEPYTPTGIFVIDEWRKIGVATEHLQVETKTYFDSLVGGNFDVAVWPLTEPADDPTAQLYYFLAHKASTMSYARHEDTKLDQIYEKQNRTLDPAERKRLVHEADRYLLDQTYSVPILWWNRIIVHHKKIKGWTMSPSHFQGTNLVEVWLDE
jgi:peptide/nickel transport system substrate-binding protein